MRISFFIRIALKFSCNRYFRFRDCHLQNHSLILSIDLSYDFLFNFNQTPLISRFSITLIALLISPMVFAKHILT